MNHADDILTSMPDRQVLLTLQALAYELHEALPNEERGLITDEDTASELLTSVLGTDSEGSADARGLLSLAASDPVIGPTARRLIDDPPRDEQMVVPILTAAIVLGAIVAMLQTRVRIEIGRRDGKNVFSVLLDKRAAEASEVNEFLKQLSNAAGGESRSG